jgi:endonuclease G
MQSFDIFSFPCGVNRETIWSEKNMFKYLGLALFAGLSFVSAAGAVDQTPPRPLQACSDQLPYGFPRTNRPDTVGICRSAYALLHDNNARVASWVAYTLTPNKTIGCAPRVNAFAPDQSLARGQRAELADYAGSGFDTGHLANNADMSWHPAIARESFILSNMAPQLPGLNRGLWRQLETIARAWAFDRENGVTIYTGSIYDLREDKRIGPNNVIVPRGFYKIIIDNDRKVSLAFVFPHRNELGSDITSVQATVADVERYTGISFPTPDNKNQRNGIWSWDLKRITAAKREACGS